MKRLCLILSGIESKVFTYEWTGYVTISFLKCLEIIFSWRFRKLYLWINSNDSDALRDPFVKIPPPWLQGLLRFYIAQFRVSYFCNQQPISLKSAILEPCMSFKISNLLFLLLVPNFMVLKNYIYLVLFFSSLVKNQSLKIFVSKLLVLCF